MKEEINLERYKQILLDELIFIRDICEKNNIKYFLYGGTLLGAVKYKGFIPWDDDVDIALLRDDYEKLLKLLEENESDDYKVLHINNTKDYYYPYAKLVAKKTKVIENAKEIKELGVFLDIFPLDGISDDYKEDFRKIRFIFNLSSKRMRIKDPINKSSIKTTQIKDVKYKKIKDFIYNFVDYVTVPLGNKFWVKLLDKNLKKRKLSDYNYVSRYKYSDEVFEKSLFEETATYEFENNEFKSMKNYDIFLKRVYGDYMKELPKELQCTHHQIKATWRNNNE